MQDYNKNNFFKFQDQLMLMVCLASKLILVQLVMPMQAEREALLIFLRIVQA